MPGIQLGKIPSSRITKVRDAIFSEMLDENLITTEVLFYTLLEQGIPKETATMLALKCHFGGRKVTSTYLKYQLLDNHKLEYDSRQITGFLKRFIRSTRIEQIDENVIAWRMNGFSTQERPFIAGIPPGHVFPDTIEDNEENKAEIPLKRKIKRNKKTKTISLNQTILNIQENEIMNDEKIIEEPKTETPIETPIENPIETPIENPIENPIEPPNDIPISEPTIEELIDVPKKRGRPKKNPNEPKKVKQTDMMTELKSLKIALYDLQIQIIVLTKTIETMQTIEPDINENPISE